MEFCHCPINNRATENHTNSTYNYKCDSQAKKTELSVYWIAFEFIKIFFAHLMENKNEKKILIFSCKIENHVIVNRRQQTFFSVLCNTYKATATKQYHKKLFRKCVQSKNKTNKRKTQIVSNLARIDVHVPSSLVRVRFAKH